MKQKKYTTYISDSEVFRNVGTLIQENASNGFKAHSYNESDGIIVAGNTTFILGSESQRQSNKNTKDEFDRFDRFFADFRGKDNSLSWNALIDEVLSNFYKKHCFLAFAPIYDKDKKKHDIDKINKFLSLLPDNIRSCLEVSDSTGSGLETVYEVAVKFRFTYKGEPRYVLNKFYFDEHFKIYGKEASKDLYQQVAEVAKIKASDYMPNAEIKSSNVNDMNGEIVSVMKNEEGFQDYLVGEAKSEFDKYCSDATNSGANNEIAIQVDRVKLRYIACLKLESRKYVIKNINTSEEVFKAETGINNVITIKCANCGVPVIKNDLVVFANKAGSPPRVDTFASVDKSDYENTEMRKHCAKSTSCVCDRLLCENSLVPCATCKSFICKDCIKPDYICTWQHEQNGKTETLYFHKNECSTFCEDTFEYLPTNIDGNSPVKKCSICNHSFSLNYFANGSDVCALCAPIASDITSPDLIDQLKEIYNIHKKMLPLHLRHKNNLCNENLNTIIFKIVSKKGNKLYLFDKKSLDLDKPLTLTKIEF